jgi:hypothetical protein
MVQIQGNPFGARENFPTSALQNLTQAF